MLTQLNLNLYIVYLRENRSLDLINLDFFLMLIIIKKTSNLIKIWYNDIMSIIDNQNNGK